ncbi:mitogen-activated protein kinase kinase kinase 5-like isoform X2 [Euphorbia lathyris]|uniref:mitogen-activated protein kinase kinase kinase 5-like isoform X2 n=1 Tax=Euphorbia lathyris TaxID=212925 RepID=UPI00331419B1
MPFLKKTVYSSSSTPSSPSFCATQTSTNVADSLSDRRKLTRQRKLRHVTHRDIGLHFTDPFNSPHDSPGSATKQPSSSNPWFSSAVPQPLPLPETPLTKRPESSGWNFGQPLLGSPDELRRNSADHVVPKSASCSSKCHCRLYQDESTNSGSRLKIAVRSAPTTPAVSPRRSNRGDLSPTNSKDSAKYLSKYTNGQSLYVNIESVSSKLSHIGSPRSAPTSGLSSPAVSPQRSKTADFLPYFMASQASPIGLDLDALDLGRVAGRTSQVSPVKTVHTPNRSPFHCQSLQIPCPSPSPKNYNKFSFTSHNKLPPGSSKEWPESNNSPHPLPLPPRATPPLSSMPLPPLVLHHTTENPNVSLRKPQWQKGKFIGRGTYGTVYVGTNRETGALCAIKEVDIIPDDPKSTECIKQLEQEIRLLRHLEHPNIVQYYGSEIVDDHFYIYLEYIYPGSISRYVQEHCGVMTESIVRNFTRHILSGLAYLHSKKTIHRDIKGANLLVDSSGVVKLADFGMAKHLTGLSYELSLKGSPHWMAPEVIKAVMQKDANPDLALAVDIWSLGCTIIEMFTGKPPWGEIQGPQAMFKVLNKSPPIPEAMSPEAKDFLHCCFRRNPAQRPSASMLLDHPFMQNSSERNMSTCRQALSTDNSQSSRECAAKSNDFMPVSPCTRVMNDKLRSNSVSQQRGVYTFNCTGSSHHRSYSQLEVLPAAQHVYSPRNFSSSSNVPSNMQLGTVNNHPLALLRSHGREVPHI